MFTFLKTTKKVKKSEKPSSSNFSDFFRKASSAQKKRVFTTVAKEATERQRAYLQ